MEHPVLGRALVLLILLCLPLASGQDCDPPGPPPPPPPPQEPDCANADPLRQPFFGDLHAHTTYSLDANLQGTRLDPDDAYRFAKGGANGTVGIQPYVEAENGDPNDPDDDVPLRTLHIGEGRELDFAMVSDHAEFFGEISLCEERDPPPPFDPADPYYFPACEYFRTNKPLAFQILNGYLALGGSRDPLCGTDGSLCFDESISFWSDIQDAAENAYDRTAACEFTSFIGYEWSKSPGARNLHRNVVFRNGDVPTRPTSFFEAGDVESLWDALETDCTQGSPGCEFLTIPHNSNLSSGMFFELVDRDGNPYTAEVAARRRLHEPLIEVMQHKGQSECLPGSGPTADELCNFEVLSFSTLAGPTSGPGGGGPPNPQDFVREALKAGLKMQHTVDENPFKYGMIGGTDTHLATPGAVAENNYPGHGGAGAAAATELPPGLTDDAYFNPGGLTGIWAEENSRDSLFAAMRRREVFATSGPRIKVRFFGSFDFDAQGMCGVGRIANADQLGVPMGADLPQAPVGESPKFLVNAEKDESGTDLERIQIIKGWVDSAGNTHEDVYDDDDFACDSELPGFAERCCVWTDPDFDPFEQAFYYVRVVENPTLRWHKRQCNAGGVDCDSPQTITEGFEACCDGSVPDTIQERAWTSPIWYRPPEWEVTQLTDDGFNSFVNKEDLQVESGGSIAWRDHNGSTWEILVHDAATQSIVQVSTGTGGNDDPRLATERNLPADWSVAWLKQVGNYRQVHFRDQRLGSIQYYTVQGYEHTLGVNTGYDVAWETTAQRDTIYSEGTQGWLSNINYNARDPIGAHLWLVWREFDGNDSEVMLYDYSDSSVTNISNNGSYDEPHAIYADADTLPLVAWCRDDHQICYLYDHSTGQTEILPTTGTVVPKSINVADGYVTWATDLGSGNYEVFLFQAGAGVIFQTDNPIRDQSPSLDPPFLVWERELGTQRIMVYDMRSGIETELDDSGVGPAVGGLALPQISNGTIVWRGAAQGSPGMDIYKARLVP